MNIPKIIEAIKEINACLYRAQDELNDAKDLIRDVQIDVALKTIEIEALEAKHG